MNYFLLLLVVFLNSMIFGCGSSSMNDETAAAAPTSGVESEASETGCGGFSFETPPADISGGLSAGYEPSGVDWHEKLNKLFLVGDGGTVTMMNKDGTEITNWSIGGDLEGITIPDSQSNFVYVGVENPDGIWEFNITTGVVTRRFDLTPWMQGPDNQGLEALTFVPNALNQEGGLFYTGHQEKGRVYIFQLPIKSSSTATAVSFINSFDPVPGRGDLSGMDYDPLNDLIYAIYDADNKLISMKPDGTFIQEWSLPHNEQEGFARNSDCDFVVAQDKPKAIWFYEGSKITISKAVMTRLTNRVATTQNNDGSFDWEHNVTDPLTPETTGFQNVTGITALGFFDTMNLTGNFLWKTNIDRTLSYLEGVLDTFLGDPTDISRNLSCPNWTFFSFYLQNNEDEALRGKVIAAFNQLLNARDATFGNDSAMRIDGLFNRILLGRSSISGIIPWDLSLCVEAVGSLSLLSSDFSGDYKDALTFLSNYTQNTFSPAYDQNNSLEYGDISLGMPLYVFAASPFSSLYASLISNLRSRLETLINTQGWVSNGSSNDGPNQATAYALLALKKIKHPQTQKVQTYLESQVDSKGLVIDPNRNVENFEVEGEVIRALSYNP